MTNADLFKQTFGIYATELWAKPEAEFLEWLNSEQESKTDTWSIKDVADTLAKHGLIVEQEPCDDANANQHNSNALNTLEGDAISRQVLDEIKELMTDINGDTVYAVRMSDIRQLPSVTQKSWKCKNCKYFEYDSVAKVDGIPLIVAHEICSRWGNGCKTKEDGYCFLFEPQESEDKE